MSGMSLRDPCTAAEKVGGPSLITRRFALEPEPVEEKKERRGLSGIATALLLITAGLCAGLLKSFLVRALLPLALTLVAAIIVTRALLQRWRRVAAENRELDREERVSSPFLRTRAGLAPTGTPTSQRSTLLRQSARQRPARFLDVSSTGMSLVAGSEDTQLLDLAAPFGTTLLCNRGRDRLLLAITSRSGSFVVGGAVSPVERKVVAALAARASVISSDESALDAIGPDGLSITLTGVELQELVRLLERIDPTSTNRVLLSDPSGAPLELHDGELVVRGHQFDLRRPIEWRPIFFQESFGQALALYQGTWIRQGSSEVVLVSLLPPSLLDPHPSDLEPAGFPELDIPAMRDQRLMQATAGAPPPKDQRVAVDGLYMLPLRVALDQAPRGAQVSSSERRV